MRLYLPTLALLAAALPALSFTLPAHAQSRVGVFASVGFNGEADGEFDGSPQTRRGDADLNQSLGVGLSYDKPLHRHFSLGLLARLYSWDADSFRWETSGDNQGLGFDLSLLPRLRFPLRSIELYGAVPVGLTAASKDDGGVGSGVEYDLGIGYNVGIFGGVQFPLSRQLGLFGEFGCQFRSVSHDWETNGGAEGDLTIMSSQWVANLGLAFL